MPPPEGRTVGWEESRWIGKGYQPDYVATEVRGDGIGFAGVGIKIGLLVSEEVLTETRLGKHHMATVWRPASRYRAPWKWVPPPGLVAEHGTAIRFQPSDGFYSHTISISVSTALNSGSPV